MKEGAAVFDPDRIEDLQFSTEKQIMDRKSARIKAVDLAIPIVAMANTDGGYLAIGIEDDGTITGFLRVGDKSKRLNFEQRLQLVYANKHYLRHNHDFVTLHGDDEVVSGAAVLLFGINPQRFFPRARIRFVRYEGKNAEVGDRMNVIKDVKFTGRILDQLPGLVRVSNIREFHFSRNPKIVELLNEYDLVKEFGEGVDRIYRDMEEAGLPEPVYRQSEFMLYATLKNKNWRKEEASWGEITYGASYDEDKLLEFCTIPRTRKELMDYMGLVNRKTFTKRFLSPLLKAGKLVMTIPDKPTSSNQKYVKR